MDHVDHTVLLLSLAAPPLVMRVGPVGNGTVGGGSERMEPKIEFKTPTIVASPAVIAPTMLAGPTVRGNSRAAV